jgi:hypothetical protein
LVGKGLLGLVATPVTQLKADPPRWFSHVLIRAYRNEGTSGARTDETTLGKIPCGAKPGGHLPSRDYYTPLPFIFCKFLASFQTKKPAHELGLYQGWRRFDSAAKTNARVDSPSGRNGNAFHDTIKGYDFY